MYVFLVILIFGKKNSISSVRTETEQKKTRTEILGFRIFLQPNCSYFFKTRNRVEEPNVHPNPSPSLSAARDQAACIGRCGQCSAA